MDNIVIKRLLKLNEYGRIPSNKGVNVDPSLKKTKSLFSCISHTQVQYILDNFEFFTGQPPPFVYQTNVQGCQVPVPFSVWERLARASQNLIKIAGRFHMKLNFIVD